MLIPARRFFLLLAVPAVLALPASIWPAIASGWWILLACVLFIALIDAALSFLPLTLRVERKLNASLPLGVWREVGLCLSHNGERRQRLEVFDHVPEQMRFRGLPHSIEIPPGRSDEFSYSVEPLQRGEMTFPGVQIRQYSPLGLWRRNHFLKETDRCRIYPNFASVSHYALLARDNHLSRIGIHKKRRRGAGQDFHQLREYRAGDPMRQVDWKASSRVHKLITREYQEERDQEVIFLLDCGYRMRTQDGELSHFDHTLNAILLLAYVALHRGDAVGLGTFSGEPRWLAPLKGMGALNHILKLIYDLQAGDLAPDYSRAATQLLARQRKRALVIVISNIRDEDSNDLQDALLLLRKRHLVMLASMRERALDEVLSKPVESLEDALRVSATHDYLHHRQRAFEAFQASGAISLDVHPQALSVAMVNRYLEIKSSGQF